MGPTGQRLSTYPFLHIGLIHVFTNVLALTPLLEKFEMENGTLVTAIMFTGRKEIVTPVNEGQTNPASFLKLSCFALHSTQLPPWDHDPSSRREVRKISLLDPTQLLIFASVWVFLLLSSTIYRTSRTTPRISIPLTGQAVPTAAIPLVLILLTSFLVPHTSFLGHCCGSIIGYAWGAEYLAFLAPPEKLLLWVEEKFALRTRLPGYYVSVEKLTYGRYGLGVLPTSTTANGVLAGP
jgi:hypothetical protein